MPSNPTRLPDDLNPHVLSWRISELSRDMDKLEQVPIELALLREASKAMETRVKNLQRGFYFFGTCVVTASIGFGVTALRVFGSPRVVDATLQVLGVG